MLMKKYMFHIIAVCFVFSFNLSFAQSWHTNFGDTLQFSDGSEACPNHCPYVKHIYVLDSSLYMGGAFTYAGNLELRHLAKWQNYQWFNLGITYSMDDTYCIIKYENKLFVGGGTGWYPNDNNNLQGLSYWDGESWHSPCTELFTGDIRNFIIFNDTLFVCGWFNEISGVPGHIVKAYYDGEWINVGDLNVNRGMVYEVYNNQLLLGTRYNGIRMRTGASTWEIFAGMSSGTVNDMVVDTINNFLYIGSAFNYVDDTLFSSNVAMYDGFQWHSLDSGVSADVLSVEMYHGDLYVGGVCSETTNGLELKYIGRWDGTQWHDLQGGCAGGVFALSVFQDTLIVGGAFYQVGLGENPQRALALAKWYMPETGCNYLQPVLHAYEEYSIPKDTFYMEDGQAEVHFYNNNAYVDSWFWDFGDGGSSDVREPVHTYTDIGEFNVQVTVTDGECIKSANKTIYIGEGSTIAQTKIPEMHLYPNPTNNDFIVEIYLPSYKNVKLKITGLNGKQIETIKIIGETTNISTRGWSSGTYVCNLFVDGKLVKVEKLVFE